MRFKYNDGGRSEAGYKGTTGDCVVRAVAIVTEKPYQEIYDLVNELAKCERTGKRKRGKSSAREGVFKGTTKKVMEHFGFKWTPTMLIGSGCNVHLKDGELPMGRVVVSVSKHVLACIDGVINDIYDDQRGGTRCVYGYWTR